MFYKKTNERLRRFPLLPLRGLLVYPSMVLHLDVGREKSVKALEKDLAYFGYRADSKNILLCGFFNINF
jgi:ATP-dependent Lon protease